MTVSEEPRSAEPAQPGRGGWLDARILLSLVVILVVAGGVALLTTNVHTGRPSADGIQGVASSKYAGSLALPSRPAPPIDLRNYMGERIDISQYKGKAVLVTFLYTNCPDVCPIIASNLGVALNLLGPAKASKVQVVAVSVDPRGDTPSAVKAFLARHDMTGRMQYLIGSASELAPVWKAWGVGSERDAQQPQFINHTGIVYGVSASGKVTTLYAASFTPSEIAHDVPLLASS